MRRLVNTYLLFTYKMVNTCSIDGCQRGWVDDKFRGFSFPFKKRQDILDTWIKFVGKKNWIPNKHSALCYEHIETIVIQFKGLLFIPP